MDESFNKPKENTFREAIGKRIKFYKEENAKFETIFNHCKLLHEPTSNWNLDLDSNMHNEVGKLGMVLEHFGITEFDGTALAMAYLEQKSEENNIIEKLKSDANLYTNFTNELKKDIDQLSWDLNESKEKLQEVFDFSKEDVYLVDKKIANYENEVAKFEKKHPWLKNPHLDLTYIAKEAQTLSGLQEEKQALEKELEIYQGLQPDLHEASQQLKVIKKHYKEMKGKFHSSV